MTRPVAKQDASTVPPQGVVPPQGAVPQQAARRAAQARRTVRPPRPTRTARLPVTRTDAQESAARGRRARVAVPRESHAALDLPAGRPDPVSLLERQAVTRVAELVPIRYGRMLASPFGFYRGAALIMANDLAATPVSGLIVQACGDAHLSNFGFFASPEHRLVFDVNDFDETLPAPWEWDVKRLAASLEIAARGRDFGRRRRREIVASTVAAYRLAMRDFARQGDLDVWYAQQDVTQLHKRFAAQLALHGRKRAEKSLAKDPARANLQELGKLTKLVDGRPRIQAAPPLLMPLAELESDPEQVQEITAGMGALITAYRRTLPDDLQVLIRQFEFADVARKVVGVGSVGMRCWILLMIGKDTSDPMFLQLKEAQPSVLAEFAGASEYANSGQRVVVGQRLMQAVSDSFLGWQRTSAQDGQHRDFYVRSLPELKLAVDVETLTPAGLTAYGKLCGATLARAHARSGDRVAIGAYLGGKDVFDRAIADFAAAYADQNERDYRVLAKAVKAGVITATPGV